MTGVETATSGLTRTIKGRQIGKRGDLFADPPGKQRPAVETHRHIGAKFQGEAGEPFRRDLGFPERKQAAKRGGRVGRAPADPGGDRQVLLQMQMHRGGRSAPSDQLPPQKIASPQYQIAALAVRRDRQIARKRAGYGEVVGIRWRECDPVAALCEGDEAFQKMMSVGALTDDMQCQVDLGRRRKGQREAGDAVGRHAIRISCPARRASSAASPWHPPRPARLA